MTTGERETAWWESFYSGEWIDVQRQLRTEKETGPEVEFLERALRLQSGARLLDVPCGVGRHSLALAARGYDVTGADITEEFLEDARREAARQNLSVRLVHRDMRKLEWTAEFDGVCHMWGSFGYFADEENAAFLHTGTCASWSGPQSSTASVTCGEVSDTSRMRRTRPSSKVWRVRSSPGDVS
jgi:cyclopropane fatty-acyl-phospholipid synthase-like methyltransferase